MERLVIYFVTKADNVYPREMVSKGRSLDVTSKLVYKPANTNRLTNEHSIINLITFSSII